MEFVGLGKSADKLPVVGMGTWKMGRNPNEEIAALKEGIRLGSRFIDTAEMYACEDLVGEAVKGQGEVFIASKVSPHHFHYEDVIKACERSVTQLGVKPIDLYQLHWPNKSVDISETMKAMEELADRGMIRHIGVSNFSLDELKEAQAAMKRHEIVSNQIEYNVMERPDPLLLDYCRKEKVTIIAYSPLGQGSLYSQGNSGVLERLAGIGSRHGKTASQAALNWLISKGNVSAIPKSGSMEHVRENVGASGWRLSQEDMREIDSFLG